MLERGRAGRGLTRPELAVLLSYAKIALQHDILQSKVPDEPQLESWLTAYFPPLLRERYRAGIDGHSLRREIIALGLTNAVVNRGGPAMAVRLAGETRRPASDVAHAFMAAREVFDLPQLWQRIDALDGRVQGEAQLRLYEATQDLVNAQTLWFLRNGAALTDLTGTIARHKAGLAALTAALDGALPPRRRADLDREARRLGEGGIPADLAADVARLDVLGEAPAITEIAQTTGQPVPEAARTFLEIGEHLRIADLGRQGRRHCVTRTSTIALPSPRRSSQLSAAQATFTRAAIAAGGAEAWRAAQGERLAACSPRWRRSPVAKARSRFRAYGGGGPAQRACGGSGRSFSISQEGPSSGSCSTCSQRKPGPLVSAHGRLVRDRYEAGACHRQRGGEHLLRQQREHGAADFGRVARRRRHEIVDVPAPGWHTVGRRGAHNPVSTACA